jgi:MFS family permease
MGSVFTRPVAAVSESSRVRSGTPRKFWTVGTLTYTRSGLIILFIWLLWGDFAWSIKERSVTPVVQILLKDFNASDTLTAVLIGTLPQAIMILLGPIVGSLSDRHRGRRGRRIPFLGIPIPFAVLAMVGLAFSPMIGMGLHHALGIHSPGKNDAVLIIIGLFWACFEIPTTIANVVFGGLINDVVPHAVVGRFYGLFRALSLIAGIIAGRWLLGNAEAHYAWIFLGTAALYGLGFLTMCLKVKEGEYPPPPARPRQVAGFLFATKAYFRECFSHPYYLWFFASISLGWMAIAPVNLFNLFFAKSLNMNMDAYWHYTALTYGFSLFLAYPLGWLADKFHPLRVGLVTISLYSAVTLWGGLFARDSHTFALAMVAHGVVSGAWMTGTAAIGQMLLPQAAFARFASALGVVVALGTMILGPVIGQLLDYSHHVYRYSYLASSGLAFLALLAGLVLHAQFMKLGGPKRYVAPEPIPG